MSRSLALLGMRSSTSAAVLPPFPVLPVFPVFPVLPVLPALPLLPAFPPFPSSYIFSAWTPMSFDGMAIS